MAVKKRPCRVCRKWFVPDVHEGLRQQFCTSAKCQKERHRRGCAAWRKRNPDWDRADRLRRRMHVEDTPVARETIAKDPMRGVRWDKVRAAVGVGVAVVVEETCGMVSDFSRQLRKQKNRPKTRGKMG